MTYVSVHTIIIIPNIIINNDCLITKILVLILILNDGLPFVILRFYFALSTYILTITYIILFYLLKSVVYRLQGINDYIIVLLVAHKIQFIKCKIFYIIYLYSIYSNVQRSTIYEIKKHNNNIQYTMIVKPIGRSWLYNQTL